MCTSYITIQLLQRDLFNFFPTPGDGVVSRQELQQFVSSSGMAELDDNEFRILFSSIDTNRDGEISYAECMSYFDSLHESIKEDFHHSIAQFLKNGLHEDIVALWSKLDLNGDGVVSVEELATFVTSEAIGFSNQDAHFLHHGIQRNGIISFPEFQSYLRSLHILSGSKMGVCIATFGR